MIEGLPQVLDRIKAADPEARDNALAAVEMVVAAATPLDQLGPIAPIRELGEYLDNPPPVPPELVTPFFLARGTVVGTVARAGYGKTSMSLNRILAWAAGQPMFQELRTAYVPHDPLKTLIIENEGAGGLFHRKIMEMLKTTERFTADEHELIRKNVLVWGEGGYAGIKLDEPKSIDTIRRGIEEWEPDAVLMEPFARLHSKNENDNSEMNVIGSVLESIAAEYKIGIIISHHESKAKWEADDEIMNRARGATALEGFVSFLEFFGKAKGGQQRELVAGKNRYGPEPKSIRMEWEDGNTGWYHYVPDAVGVDEVLALLPEPGDNPAIVIDLAEELNETQSRIKRLLERAEGEGRARAVRKHGSKTGWYLATEDELDEPRQEGAKF